MVHDSVTSDQLDAAEPREKALSRPVLKGGVVMRAVDMGQRASVLSRLHDLLLGDWAREAVEVEVIATYASPDAPAVSLPRDAVRIGGSSMPSGTIETEPGERAAQHVLDDLDHRRGSVAASLAGPASTVIDDVRDLLADIDIEAGARRAILEVPMLTSAAVAGALGAQGKNLRETASRLRTSGTLVGVPNPDGRGYLHPLFQFDLAHRRVHPVVAEVNRATGAAGDPWGVASWWVSRHGRLGELAPMDLIATDREHDLLVMADLAPRESASDARAALAALAALDVEHE